MRRSLRPSSVLLSVLALVGAGLAAVAVAPSAGADPDFPERWCSSTAPPCVESADRDGVAITAASTDYQVQWPWWVSGASTPDDRFFQVVKGTGTGWSYDLGSAEIGHTFTITYDTGSMKPRALWAWAQPAPGVTTTDRWQTADGHWHVTMALQPVRRLSACRTDDMNVTTCPFTATPGDEIQAQLYGTIDDASWWGTTEDDHDQLMGLDSFTNVDFTYQQPEIAVDPTTGDATLTIPMGNAHEDAAHHTFFGFQDIRLPNRMLREVYGIPDPTSMTTGSLSGSVSGGVGTVSTYPDPGGDAWHVDASDVTFSKRRLTVTTGTITPTRPSRLHAKRTAATRARLGFRASSPRGARVQGYDARCTSPSGDVRRGHADASPVVVRHLRAGAPYSCRVRATSKVGPSRWSAAVTVARRP